MMPTLEQLTDEQIDAMEASAAMDCAVARACGIEHKEKDPCLIVARGVEFPFLPSINWQESMVAASQFRLWSDGEILLTSGSGEYRVVAYDGEWESFSVVAAARSGPLAICRAILKLARDR